MALRRLAIFYRVIVLVDRNDERICIAEALYTP